MLPIVNTNIAEISDLLFQTVLSKTREIKAEFYWGIRRFGAAEL